MSQSLQELVQAVTDELGPAVLHCVAANDQIHRRPLHVSRRPDGGRKHGTTGDKRTRK